MPGFKHIFFDLDHTLWDFQTNSRLTLSELFDRYRRHIGEEVDFEEFFFHYSHVNNNLWTLYREGKIGQSFLRSRRFPEAFEKLGIESNDWMEEFGQAYTVECPVKPHLIEEAEHILEELAPKYRLHIITNGFDETQDIKLRSSGLKKYFDQVITSEMAAAKKPDPRIFQFALQQAQAEPAECAYVGDDYVADVMGGMEFGIFTIFFNPDRKANPLRAPEVQKLSQLKRYF